MARFEQVAILAGGAGTRLGGRKPMATVAGNPLIERAVFTVRAAGLDPLVVAKEESELPRLDAAVLREPDEPRHPLAGLVAALGVADGVVVMACDMPLVPPELLAWLAVVPDEHAVCRGADGLEPLLGRYSSSATAVLARALARGAPARAAVAELGPRIVDRGELERFGPPEELLFNVNTPADAERAARLLGGQTRG